jgi:hypothetical protein
VVSSTNIASWHKFSAPTAGVGGEHDAGVPEHVLDDFQVGAACQGEAGGAMAEVAQADRRQAAGGT